MTEQEKIALLTTAKDLFRNSFATNHYRNTEGLDKISKFNINPFLHKYLTMFTSLDKGTQPFVVCDG